MAHSGSLDSILTCWSLNYTVIYLIELHWCQALCQELYMHNHIWSSLHGADTVILIEEMTLLKLRELTLHH